MNLSELQDIVNTLVNSCSSQGINPDTVHVNVLYQPNFPLEGHLNGYGFIDTGRVHKLVLGLSQSHYPSFGYNDLDEAQDLFPQPLPIK